MLEERVIPRLGHRGAGAATVRRLRVFGLPEASLDRALGRMMDPESEPALGLTARGAVHTITIVSRRPAAVAEPAVREVEARIRGLLGDLVLGRDEDTLESAVARELTRTGLTLAVAESCTGGLVTARLIDVPGISAHLLEGVVTYANEAKVRRLGVAPGTLEAHGAVSAETAAEMAEGVRRTAGADVGLSTTGIAGPEGGSAGKPVGLVYTGSSLGGRIRVARHVHFGDRRVVRDRAAKTALDILRRALMTEGR
jgi:nicotinamide-nucleotide amidase